MYKVFNMGSLLEIYTDAQTAEQLIAIGKSHRIDTQIIGYVEASETKGVHITSAHGEFDY
jgi:phosphoribosylformylglycinamidine cyclo-ligase